MPNLQDILSKYEDTIKEELNIKEVIWFQEEVKITKVFKPNWAKLSNKFGKDTGKIIQFGKKWNIKELNQGQVKVFDDQNNERILEKEEYEIMYEWLTWEDMAVDQNLVVKLDLNITPQLQKEWVAREVSRFLNQMRKDADYSVDAKVEMTFETQDQYLKEVILEFSDFLWHEALLQNVKNSTPEWNLVSDFDYEWKIVKIWLQK